jgi:hypothetical protein
VLNAELVINQQELAIWQLSVTLPDRSQYFPDVATAHKLDESV